MRPANEIRPAMFLCPYEAASALQIDVLTPEVGFLMVGAWHAVKSGPSTFSQSRQDAEGPECTGTVHVCRADS